MSESPELTFFSRLWMAWVCFFQILFNGAFARAVFPAYQARRGLPAPADSAPKPAAVAVAPPPAAKPAAPPPEKEHGSALFLLSILQREGRFIDFLKEDVASFSDAEVGAAARVVHGGCQKVLAQYLPTKPVRTEGEGDNVTVPAGFDNTRVRLTGNVAGSPPFSGALRHKGWEVTEVKLPPVPTLDLRVVAPAEVELP